MEIWTDIIEYPQYEISNYGRVRNKRTNTILKGSINNHGYVRFDLCDNGKRVVRSGHRLVATHFLDMIEGLNCVNHKDGDKTNNHVSNLEWCDIKWNANHASSVLGHMVPKNKRQVYCIDLNKAYSSITEAATTENVSYNTILRSCQGKVSNPRTYKWKYI